MTAHTSQYVLTEQKYIVQVIQLSHKDWSIQASQRLDRLCMRRIRSPLLRTVGYNIIPIQTRTRNDQLVHTVDC
jgi:hypothetical protein